MNEVIIEFGHITIRLFEIIEIEDNLEDGLVDDKFIESFESIEDCMIFIETNYADHDVYYRNEKQPQFIYAEY